MFWIVKGVPEWFLAIVDDVHEDEIDVLPLCPSPRKNRIEWVYPQNNKIYSIDEEQIIKQNILVGYLPTERIKCVISYALVSEIEQILQTIIDNDKKRD